MKPQLLITTDDAADKALIRGVEAEPATRAVCPEVRRYTRAARGWVVPIDVVGDLLAFAQYYRVFAVSHPRKRGVGESQ